MSFSSRSVLPLAIGGAFAPRVDEARTAQAPSGDSGSPVRRSPLADPKFGLAWSNPAAPDEVLVRSALRHGAFHLLLEAALHHGVPYVELQLSVLQSSDDDALSDHALTDVRRKLVNIARGIAAAEQAAQEVPHPEAGRPSAGLGLREGRK